MVAVDDKPAKPNISDRMAALRKRKQDRAMERKEAQVEAGVDQLAVATRASPAHSSSFFSANAASPSSAGSPGAAGSPGFFSPGTEASPGFFDGADGGQGALSGSNDCGSLPMHQSVEQWEAYFGQLAAAGCDDGVRLSTAEMALLAVHGAYSSRLEEVNEANEETPHFDTIDELNQYTDELRALGRSQLTGIQRTVLNVKQVFSADVRKAQDKILMLEHELQQMKVQLLAGSPQSTGLSANADESDPACPLTPGGGFSNAPRLTKDDIIDDQRKEIAIADIELNKKNNKISKLDFVVSEMAALAVYSTCRPLCQLYLERGMAKWKLALLKARNIARYDSHVELHDARLSKLDQQDAAAWDSPDAAEERRRRLSSPVHKQTGEIDPSVVGQSQQLHRALQAEEVESPQYATQYQMLYESNMNAMLAARKKRLQRLQRDEEWTDSDSDHYASDEEMNQVLRSTEEAGKVGVILSYAAGLSLNMKQKEWLMAFMRLHNEWHLSAITRLAWAYNMWSSYKTRQMNNSRGKALRNLEADHTELQQRLENVTAKFDIFRQGRVGTYSGKGRHDSDQEMEDDYTQLAAYTRKMNINWAKERLCRGCDQASSCFVANYRRFWAAIFYTWRQNTIKLKLLSHKYSLGELDKLELVSERLEANSDLKDERRVREALQDTNDKLKRELAKLRRDKAWMERFTTTGAQ